MSTISCKLERIQPLLDQAITSFYLLVLVSWIRLLYSIYRTQTNSYFVIQTLPASCQGVLEATVNSIRLPVPFTATLDRRPTPTDALGLSTLLSLQDLRTLSATVPQGTFNNSLASILGCRDTPWSRHRPLHRHKCCFCCVLQASSSNTLRHRGLQKLTRFLSYTGDHELSSQPGSNALRHHQPAGKLPSLFECPGGQWPTA